MLLKELLFSKLFTTLDRYLIQQFLGPFSIAVAGFAIIGIADILFYIVELSVLSGLSLRVTIQLLLYKLPAVLILFFPMAALFATMLLFVRMAKDSELTILQTSGISVIRIISPILLIGIVISLTAYFINDVLVPLSNSAAETLITRELKKAPPPSISQNTIFKDSGRFFYVRSIHENKMSNILVLEKTFSSPRVIIAKSGEWQEFKWLLQDGFIQEFNPDGTLSFSSTFEQLIINIHQNIKRYYSSQKKPREMDSTELKEQISRLADSGLASTSYQLEYHLKKSVPATCLVFVVIGICYCFSFVRTGNDWWGVIVAICMATLSVGLFFVLLAVSRALAKGGHLSPLVGAWLPNSIYGLIAGLLTYRQCHLK